MCSFLWRKTISDSWRQLVLSSLFLLLFGWLFVWMTSLLRLGAMPALLRVLPKFVEPLLGVPIDELASTTGRLTFVYVHIITLLICVGWAIGRGSDVVAGEISRGTMDLLLSLPIRRFSLLTVSGVTTLFGAAVLAFSLWTGSWIGLKTIALPQEAAIGRFLPGVLNLASVTFCLAGLSAMLSSWDRNRWRTIWLACGLFVVESVVKMIARLWQPEGPLAHLAGALGYFTFLTAFEPQRLILIQDKATAQLAWQYDGTLLGIGLLGYLVAAVVFTCRDIPQAF
ncbi:MAG: ABC transporter permease subunit [Thermoguttaceae bacterium]